MKKTIFVLAIFICFGLLLVGYLLFNSNEMRTISTNDLLKKSELKDKKKRISCLYNVYSRRV